MQRIMEEVQFWQIWLEGVCGRWIKTTKTDLFKDWSIFRERRYKDCWAEKHRRPCTLIQNAWKSIKKQRDVNRFS